MAHENYINDEEQEISMKYYKTKAEAVKRRVTGSRIYYRKGKGYYIVNPKKIKWFSFRR